MAKVKITREKTAPADQDLQMYQMRITASEAEGMPAELFVFKETTQDGIREFVHIATPSDLEELNTDAPYATKGVPYFRLPQVTLKFRCKVEMEETWEYIKEDIAGLLLAINYTDTETEEVIFE